MSRKKKLFGMLVAGLTGLTGSAWWLLRRPLPPIEGTQALPGLIDEVEIIRDRWGVPHIYAQTVQDLFFTQGFVHAQERLWQMDFQRRLVAGRLSEIFGATTINMDRWMRTLGLRRQVEIDIDSMSDESQRVLQAFAKGVNRYIETAPALPVEFTLLRYEPEPWTPLDSLSWGKMIAFGLSTDWDSEIIRAQITARLGAEMASLLEGAYPPENPVIVAEMEDATLGLSALARRRNGPFEGDLGASNSWVVNGARSQTGKPLLANDPHLPIRVPGIWFENHLTGPHHSVTGVSLPGVPAILIGHNEHIAWGFTAALADTQDLFMERFHSDQPHLYQVQDEWQPATVYREEIQVRGQREPVIEEVVVTRHGPIITDLAPNETQPLALRWTGYDPDRGSLDCFLHLNRARNWEDTLEALKKLDALTLNFTYADTRGNIGYQLAGKIPVRPHRDGRLPVPGWTNEYEWEGYLPLSELPRCYNPAQGFIVTANNKPIGDDYPHYLGYGWRPGFRARRITDLIEAHAQHERSTFQSIQMDQLSIPMKRLAERLAQLTFETPRLQVAQADLAYWNGCMDQQSIGATLTYTTLNHLRYRLFQDLLGPITDYYMGKGFHPLLYPISGMGAKNIAFTLSLLEEKEIPWQPTQTMEQVLKESFAAAVEQLTAMLGPNMNRWRWGTINQLHLMHPLGTVRPLRRLFCRGPYPAGGDPFTVCPNAARFHPDDKDFHSASCRLIIDLADFSRSVSICPPGQSGHPASPHFTDQVNDWLAGRYHPMLWERSEIERAATGTLRLVPAATPTPADSSASSPPAPFLARLLNRGTSGPTQDHAGLPPELAYEPSDPAYAYKVYWVKVTQNWPVDQQRAVLDALTGLLQRPDFEANPTERRYHVPGLSGQYSGLSLTALQEVLQNRLEAGA